MWSIGCRGRGLNLAWFRLEGKKEEGIAKNGGGWRDEDRRPRMSAKEMEEADARDNAVGAEGLPLVGQRGGDGGRGRVKRGRGKGVGERDSRRVDVARWWEVWEGGGRGEREERNGTGLFQCAAGGHRGGGAVLLLLYIHPELYAPSTAS